MEQVNTEKQLQRRKLQEGIDIHNPHGSHPDYGGRGIYIQISESFFIRRGFRPCHCAGSGNSLKRRYHQLYHKHSFAGSGSDLFGKKLQHQDDLCKSFDVDGIKFHGICFSNERSSDRSANVGAFVCHFSAWPSVQRFYLTWAPPQEGWKSSP